MSAISLNCRNPFSIKEQKVIGEALIALSLFVATVAIVLIISSQCFQSSIQDALKDLNKAPVGSSPHKWDILELTAKNFDQMNQYWSQVESLTMAIAIPTALALGLGGLAIKYGRKGPAQVSSETFCERNQEAATKALFATAVCLYLVALTLLLSTNTMLLQLHDTQKALIEAGSRSPDKWIISQVINQKIEVASNSLDKTSALYSASIGGSAFLPFMLGFICLAGVLSREHKKRHESLAPSN